MNVWTLINEEVALLEEGVKDLRKRYVENGPFESDLFDKLVSRDPTKTKKYLGWILKIATEEIEKNQAISPPYNIDNAYYYIDNLITSKVLDFNDYVNKGKIDEKDIYQYDLLGLYMELRNASTRLTRKELKEFIKQNDIRVKDRNDEFIVACPLTKKGMNYLGINTKWCITSTDLQFWFEHIYDFKKVPYVVIDLTNPDEQDPLKRVVYMFSTELGGTSSVWNALDSQIANDADVEFGLDADNDDDAFHELDKRLLNSGIDIQTYHAATDLKSIYQRDTRIQNPILNKKIEELIDEIECSFEFSKDEDTRLTTQATLSFQIGYNSAYTDEAMDTVRLKFDSFPGDPFSYKGRPDPDLENYEFYDDEDDDADELNPLDKIYFDEELNAVIAKLHFPITWTDAYKGIINNSLAYKLPLKHMQQFITTAFAKENNDAL